MSAKPQSPPINIQSVLANNQTLVEILREDRAASDEQILSLKLANRNAIKNSEALREKIATLEEQAASATKRIAEQDESNNTLRNRLSGVEWYLGKVSNQEVTPEFLKEVHEIYLAELEERRLRANKRSVAKSYEEKEKEEAQKIADENEARNVVMRKQAELKEQLEQKAPEVSEVNDSETEVEVVAEVIVDEDVDSPPAQINKEELPATHTNITHAENPASNSTQPNQPTQRFKKKKRNA